MSAIPKTSTVNHSRHAHAWAPAALACMGVVFGDIGTSPLYALSVAVKAAGPDGQISPHAVLGVVSLIFWSLIVVISIKYAILIMRADNHGEGGILALLALVSPRRAKQSRWRAIMVVIGLIGATLLYGDGCITPAISVLSAIEGIKVDAPHMEHAVVPLTVVILALLFLIQRNGTAWIGGIFGPVMLAWFVVAGVLGIGGIAKTSRRARRIESVAGHHLSLACWAAGVCCDRRCVPSRDRWRSVLRRYGAFRSISNSSCLVRRGATCANS